MMGEDAACAAPSEPSLDALGVAAAAIRVQARQCLAEATAVACYADEKRRAAADLDAMAKVYDEIVEALKKGAE